MYEHLRIKKKTTEDVMESVAQLHNNVKSCEDRQRRIDQDFSILQYNIADKFQLLFESIHTMRKSHSTRIDRATNGADVKRDSSNSGAGYAGGTTSTSFL